MSSSLILPDHLLSSSSMPAMKENRIESSEAWIIAQASPSSNQPQPSSMSMFLTVGGSIALTVLVMVGAIAIWPQIKKLLQSFQEANSHRIPDASIPSQEFAVDIEVSNIRTQDYLRANVQATIYVFIEDKEKDKRKAEEYLMVDDNISAAVVEKLVKKRAESAIRGSASEKGLDEIHKARIQVGQRAKELMGNCLIDVGLTIREIVIGEIEENPNYVATNYFDAKALAARTAVIQPAISSTRQQELKVAEEIREIELASEQLIRQKELEAEKNLREKELDIGKEIRIKELEVSFEIEQEEVKRQNDSLANLKALEKVETEKIDYELKIELHKNGKEKELQKAIEKSELDVKKDIEMLRSKTEVEIQLDKILKDQAFIAKNKEFQKQQAQANQEVEKEEIKAMIAILDEEQKRLEKEIERAKTEEELTTAIEVAKSERQKQTAEIAAQAVENEAKTIERLAQAEAIRYQGIPPTDMALLIRELAPMMEKLPQLAEVVKALAPQAGILGNSNVYTFPNGNGEDINKLMLSTSGILLLQSLLDGKVGQFLGQSFNSYKDKNSNGNAQLVVTDENHSID